ncbi:MAG: caspase domain-containing protein [Gemmataceae bacterium]
MTSPVLRARCGQCQSRLRIPREWLGETVRCKNCRAVYKTRMRTPPPESMAFAPDDRAPTEALSDSAFADLQIQRAMPSSKPSRIGWIIATCFGLSLGVLGVVGFTIRDRMAGGPAAPVVDKSPPTPVTMATPQPEKKPAPPPAKKEVQFPRRMLAICVNQYLYANPVSFGLPKRNGSALLDKFNTQFRFPKEQLYLLSDARSNRGSIPPTKPVIQAAIEQFLAGSRSQDRIIVLFSGHGAVIEGKPYLVPLDGEFANPASLVEFDWLFQKLKDSKARQKILIVDVCRHDPRGSERPSSGPMDPEFEVKLKAPPEGVQVWSACSAKEYSYDLRNQVFEGFDVDSGLFLNQMFNGFSKLGSAEPKPDQSIPIDELSKHVNALTSAMAQGVLKQPQTPFLAGAEKTDGAAFNPADPPAPRMTLPKPQQFVQGGVADAALIKGIFEEIKLPPIKAVGPEDSASDDIASQLPYSAAAMKGYEADETLREILDHPDKYPVRSAVLHAHEILERHARGEVKLGHSTKKVGPLRQTFLGPNDENKKRGIEREQREGPAAMVIELEDALESLAKFEAKRAEEPSTRWQAHFDYVHAMLKSRYAYVNEFNLMLGKIRKDELPALDPSHNGWRLTSQEKMASPKDVKEKAEEAKKLFAQIIKDHPGTPWEVLAKRERLTALGLTWQPASVKK